MTRRDWTLTPPAGAGNRDRRRLGPSGWSLLELALAALFFEVALLGVAPLFVRAVADVRVGGERAQAAALAASRLESAATPGSPSAPLPGSSREFYSRAERRWLASMPPPPDLALWVASTTIRRYPLTSIDDGRVDRAEALGDPDPDPTTGPPPIRLEGREIVLARTLGDRPELILESFRWVVD
jgi:hypothetical protein